MEDELLSDTQRTEDKVELHFASNPKCPYSKLSIGLIVSVIVALIVAAVVIALFASGVIGGKTTSTTISNTSRDGVPGQYWDYVTVRPGAHMFYMFYGTTKSSPRDQVPLILWLQGGPGGSSTGFGNFGEIGPLDVNLKARSSTWLSRANLLFIDNPVGAGWSYVENSSQYTTDVDQIAKDLVVAIKAIFNKLPKMQKVPFYIFAESYGGKMTVAFAIQLKQAMASNNVQCDFRGVGLGDSWISPYDYVNTWGPYLFTLSLLDKKEENSVQYYASAIAQALQNKQYQNATNLWRTTEGYIEAVTSNVNFYNVLSHSYGFIYKRHQLDQDKVHAYYQAVSTRAQKRTFSSIMNSDVRKMLGNIVPSSVQWGGQANQVFKYQEVDFMKPVIDKVDQLLNMNVTVAIYNGQLDVICDTLGTEAWMAKLKWKNLQNFKSAKKHTMKLTTTQTVAGFYKKYANLSFFWILKAGHMVPVDAPQAALQMVDTIFTF